MPGLGGGFARAGRPVEMQASGDAGKRRGQSLLVRCGWGPERSGAGVGGETREGRPSAPPYHTSMPPPSSHLNAPPSWQLNALPLMAPCCPRPMVSLQCLCTALGTISWMPSNPRLGLGLRTVREPHSQGYTPIASPRHKRGHGVGAGVWALYLLPLFLLLHYGPLQGLGGTCIRAGSRTDHGLQHGTCRVRVRAGVPEGSLRSA